MNRPIINKLQLTNIIGYDISKPCIIGIRGFFLNQMGEKNRNDRGIYDDALFIYDGLNITGYNANVDPSKYGINPKIGKGYANLEVGEYQYKLGIHGLSKDVSKQYEALVQHQKVDVKRDDGKEEAGFFGINIHRGGINGTSSEGCQTITHTQWVEFITHVKGIWTKSDIITYILANQHAKG